MKRWIRVVALLAMGAWSAAAQAQSQPSMLYGVTTTVAPISADILSSPQYAQLIADLQAGGHVIYLRLP